MDEPARRPMTESEYAAMLPYRAARMADKLTATLPEEVRAAGIRFEWTPGDDGAE